MRLLERSAINLAGTGLVTVLNLAVGVVLARSLSPKGFGQFALVTSSTSAIAYVLSLALGSAGVYFINRLEKDSSFVATLVVKISLMSATITGIIIFALLNWESYFGVISMPARLSVTVFAASILMTATLDQILLTFFDIKLYVIVRLVPSAVLLILVFVTVFNVSGTLTVSAAWAYSMAGQVLGVSCIVWFLRGWIHPGIRIVWSEAAKLLKFGISLSLAFAVNLLHGELGLLLLRYFSNDFEEVGFYRVAVRLGSILLLFAASITPLLFARWSAEEGTNRRDQVERVSRVFWLVIAVSVCCFEVVAGLVINLLYGQEYAPAVSVFRLLLIGVAFRAMLSPLIQLFAGGGKPIITTLVLGVNLVLLAILVAIFSREMGAYGAAIGFVISSALALVMAYVVSGREFDIRIRRCFFITSDDVKYIANAGMAWIQRSRSHS